MNREIIEVTVLGAVVVLVVMAMAVFAPIILVGALLLGLFLATSLAVGMMVVLLWAGFHGDRP